MIPLILPIASGVAHQEQTLTLDGRRYRLRLDWSGRLDRWAFDLLDSAEVPIVLSGGLVLGTDMLRQVRSSPRTPPGALVLLDTEGQDAEATLFSLGGRHALVYIEGDDTQDSAAARALGSAGGGGD